MKILFYFLAPLLLLTGCSNSIQPLGEIGPKKLKVYAIAQNDFLTANRLLVILDKKGNVAAFTGGTTSGMGTVGLETGATVVSAGAMLYGAKALEHGLENAHVTSNGIPSHMDVNVTSDLLKKK